MNRLESIRDVPDAAWTETPERIARESPRASGAAARPVWLPWRAVRVALRDPSRTWLILRMAFAYLEISLLARLLPLPKAFALISPRAGASQPDEAAARNVVNALDTLLVARVPFIRPQCWRRAAVLRRFLRFVGVDTTIVFGVTTEGKPPVEAHAWLERDGKPFAEAPKAKLYRRVFEFPAVASSRPS